MHLLERCFTPEFVAAPRIGAQFAIVSAGTYALIRYWPETGSAPPDYVPVAFSGFFLTVIGLNTVKRIINYHIQVSRRQAAYNKRTNPNDARFATEADLDAIDAFNPNNGIPVGKLNDRPFFFPFTHNLVVAPAGTQKTVAAVIPAITHGYRIPGNKRHHSKAASRIIMDLKRENHPMTERLSHELHGHRVIKLDPADPNSDSYNLLDPVKDALEGRIPREKALTLAGLVAHILEPEPHDDAKNRFWREGGRDFVIVVILWVCLFEPGQATMPEVCRIIRNPNTLLDVLEECTTLADSEDAIQRELSTLAHDKLAQGNYFDEFRTGSSQAVKLFSEAGELAHVTGPSTFRWSDAKRESVTIYVCSNLSESRVFKRWLSAIADEMMMELEYFPGNVPVHICLEEATNIGFDVSKYMTALRGVGVRLQVIIQERSEAKRVWGEQAAHSVQNEVDLEQYFGISDPQLADDLEKRLGTIEVIKQSFQTGAEFTDQYTQSANIQRKPLMSAYHLQYRMAPEDQIVFLRGKVKLDPIYCQKLTYDDVLEWLEHLDDNPVEGGKLPGPPSIRMTYNDKGVRVRRYRRDHRKTLHKLLRITQAVCPPLWFNWTVIWLLLGVYGVSVLG